MRKSLATLAVLAVAATTVLTSATAQADDKRPGIQGSSKISINVSASNLPAGLDAEKVAELIRVRTCPVALDVVTIPATVPADCISDDFVTKVSEDDAKITDGVFTSVAKIPSVLTATNLAVYVENKAKGELGLAAASTPAFLAPVDATTTSIAAVAAHVLPNLTTPVTGEVKDGKSVLVNLTVTGVVSGKNSKLASVVRVRVCPLAADATVAPEVVPADCAANSKTLKEVTKPSGKTAGLFTAKVRLASPAASTSQNYALYVVIRNKKELGLTTQTGVGQFVTVTSDANGAGSVTTGVDGLTLSLTANAGSGSNAKVIDVVVPAVGSYAVVFTGSEGKSIVVPVAAGSATVAIPAKLEKGTFTAQLVSIAATGQFTIDKYGNLSAPLTLSAVLP